MNAKTLKDRNGKEITKGAVVRYKDGWVRVFAVFVGKQQVNLGGIHNGRLYHKKVSVTEVYEDHETWYTGWTKSETYQSM